MASYDWVTLVLGIAGALLGALVTGGIARVTWRRQQQQQREWFEREWQRRSAHEVLAERDTDLASDEVRYRNWMTRQYRYLSMTGLRTRAPVELELERVYVSLKFASRTFSHLPGTDDASSRLGADDLTYLIRQAERDTLNMAEALNAMDHKRIVGLVILGGPGTGKTTALRYLALTFAHDLQGERLYQAQPMLPLLISLRDLPSENTLSLADYMTHWCQRQGCHLEPNFFEAQLRQGRCLVLLDGLDEVASESQRRAVSRWIERQSGAYVGNPFVVTCRPVGFRDDFLPPRFLRLEVQDFGEDEVELFAQNWCRAVEMMLKGDTAESHNKALADSAELVRVIEDDERVKALAVNPLMLSIMALVHRYRVRLPDRRVELYAECVEVLLGHWDEAKAMEVAIPPYRAMEVLQSVALWMQEQKTAGGCERVVQRRELEQVVQGFLVSIGLRADDAARFLDRIRDRSGLLVERGAGVFGFQYQAFQEYLAAREIAAQGLESLLVKSFGADEWRGVALLYVGLHDASALFEGLLALPEERLVVHWPLLLQMLHEAIAVETSVREAIYARVSNHLIELRVKTGHKVFVDVETPFALVIVNQGSAPMATVRVEVKPSDDYTIKGDNPVILDDLEPNQPREVVFDICVHVRAETTVNIVVNDRIHALPVRPYDIKNNPYSYGPPIDKPTEFFGRQHELDDIFQAVTKANKQDILLIGERRTGKTSLLLQIHQQLIAPYIPIYMVMNTVPPEVDHLSVHILKSIVKAFAERDILPSDFLQQGEPPALDSFFDLIGDIFTEAKRHLPDVKVVLLIDEADYLLRVDPRIQNVLRATLQSSRAGSSLRAVFAGTRELRQHIAQKSSPFFNHFRSVHLRPLDFDETRDLMIKPAEDLGYLYKKDAVKMVFELCGGHPYYTQRVCYEVFNLALTHQRRQIDQKIVSQAVQAIVSSPDDDAFRSFEEYFWKPASQKERKFLQRLAASNEKIPGSRREYERLIEWQVVWEKDGYFEYTALIFAKWVARLGAPGDAG